MVPRSGVFGYHVGWNEEPSGEFRMKKIGIVLLGLIVLLVVAVLAVPRLIDWNGYKAEIAQAVKEATGRDLTIGGDIEVSILPDVSFALSGLTLSNAEGVAEPPMFTLESLRGRLALFPLLSRDVIVEELVIRAPVLHLAVDEGGQPNWVFDGAKPQPAASKRQDAGEGGLPFSGLTLENVRLEDGQVSFHDARSGQQVVAKAINLRVALAALSAPFTLAGDLIGNDDSVAVELSLDSPGGLLAGRRAALAAAIEAKHIKLSYNGRLQQKPAPSLDGTFALAIPSVGRLAAWLKRPLADGQPDPGPLKVRAVFEGEGAKVTLKEATIDGDALQVKATGSIDGSGAIKRVSFNLETGVLDLDRYLPPPVEPSPTGRGGEDAPGTKAKRDPFEAIPDEPFDLSPLKQIEAKINVAVAGVRAMGYRVGKVAFKADLRGGELTAKLNELGLYGGGVAGELRFDGSGDTLGVAMTFMVDMVDVGALARAVQGDQAMVAGIASGRLEAKGRGTSPRALAQSLVAAASFSLGGVNVKDAPGVISKLDLSVDFPGVEANPSVEATLVYNNEPVAVSFTLDPLPKVLSGQRFETKLDVKSRRFNLNYDGGIQIQPLPGLSGRFALDVPSVGKLLTWLEIPLPKNQPDPGPLKIKAVMSADGAKISLKEAFIDGAALKAKATGSFDGSGDVAKFALDLEAGVLDIDRYLPPAAKSAGPAAGEAPAATSGDLLAALTNEPFDLSPLKNIEGRVSVTVLGLKALGFEFGEIALAANLKDSLLDARLDKFRLYGGGVTGTLKLDGAGDALGVDAALKFDRVDVGRLADAALGAGVAGVASGTLRAKGRGKSPRAMLARLNAGATLELAGIDLKEAGLLSEAALSIDTAGFEGPSTMKGRVVYNQEKVEFDVAIAALKPALLGQVVDLTAAIRSDPLKARYSGKVHSRPDPGLRGNLDLDISSVGKLLAWFDNPLPKDQPDPGPLKVRAVIATDGAKLAIEEAVIEGKALMAKATARLDGGQKVKRFEVNVEIDEADLNAYLPPRKKKEKETVPEMSKGPARWNEEPFDFSALRQAEGQATVKIGHVRYRELDIMEGLVSVGLNKGVLNAVVDGLRLAGGVVDLRATLDASGKPPEIDYQVNVVGVQARPLLKTFADTDLLSGATALRATGSAHGISQKRMVETLNGNGRIRFKDGAIHGINIAQTLRKAQTLGFGDAGEQKTDFAELSGSFTITNGVLDNRDLKMLAPVLRLTGKGLVPMPPRTIDYEVVAKLVSSLQGQGGQDALAGLPIPITIKGSWDDPSIAADWKSVFALAATIPGRVANMPVDLLEFGKGLGIPLPVPGLSTGGDKTGGAGGILGGVLKMIPGVTGSQQQEPEPPTQQPAQEQPKQQQAPNPLNTLKKLFGN